MSSLIRIFVTDISALLLLFTVAEVQAQTTQTVTDGSRVLITAPSLGFHEDVGTVQSVEQNSWIIRFEETGETHTVRLHQVTGVRVSIGRRTKAKRGLGRGVLFGALPGFVIGVADGSDEFGSAGAKGLVLGLLTGAAGGVVGLAIGSQLREDIWIPASVEPELRVQGWRASVPRSVRFVWTIRF